MFSKSENGLLSRVTFGDVGCVSIGIAEHDLNSHIDMVFEVADAYL